MFKTNNWVKRNNSKGSGIGTLMPSSLPFTQPTLTIDQIVAAQRAAAERVPLALRQEVSTIQVEAGKLYASLTDTSLKGFAYQAVVYAREFIARMKELAPIDELEGIKRRAQLALNLAKGISLVAETKAVPNSYTSVALGREPLYKVPTSPFMVRNYFKRIQELAKERSNILNSYSPVPDSTVSRIASVSTLDPSDKEYIKQAALSIVPSSLKSEADSLLTEANKLVSSMSNVQQNSKSQDWFNAAKSTLNSIQLSKDSFDYKVSVLSSINSLEQPILHMRHYLGILKNQITNVNNLNDSVASTIVPIVKIAVEPVVSAAPIVIKPITSSETPIVPVYNNVSSIPLKEALTNQTVKSSINNPPISPTYNGDLSKASSNKSKADSGEDVIIDEAPKSKAPMVIGALAGLGALYFYMKE